MAAIMGASPEQVAELCKESAEGEVLGPANFNAPGQIVIAGTMTAVNRAAELAKQQKLRAIVLNVSAPFHSELMAPAAARVRAALSEIAVGAPAFPVVANVTAEPNTRQDRVADLLVQQVDSPVRWDDSIRKMAELGVTRTLELGTGSVLSGLVKRIDRNLGVHSINSIEALYKTREWLGAAV
jgi:[acyl-carrier-protein] S-malonyltransferase